MPLAIPTTKQLVQRLASAMLAQQFVADDGTIVRLDPNAPGTLEQVLGTVWALAMREIYAWQRDYCLELMVTTATENGLLPQHAEMWGVPRNPAASAIGTVQVTASAAVTLPIGTAFVSDGSVQWLVTSATSIGAGTTANVPVQASKSGTIGNLAAGTELALVSPVAGITAVVVDSQGLAGGSVIEPVESWRTRIIDKIRNPIGAGTDSDYESWAMAAGAAYVNVFSDIYGSGTVGVAIAMAGPIAPTAAQIAAVQDYIDKRRPVTAQVFVIAAQLVSRSPTIALSPDTISGRRQIAAELASYYPSVGIGGKIYISEIFRVLNAVNGTKSDLISPLSDELLNPNEIAVLGTIDWASPE